MTAFDDVAGIGPQRIWEGIVSRSVGGERITLAVVELDPGTVVGEHSHANEQLGIVLRGLMRFRIGDEERNLGPGGTWNIPANTPHSATAGPDGATVIDVFSPPRDDWDALEREPPRPGRWP